MSDQQHSRPVFGIDLGTTNSCIGMYRDGKVTILHNQHMKKTTPSIVAFIGDGSLVGEHAIRQQLHNPQNTIYESKRIIGQCSARIKQQFLPFNIEADGQGRPWYNVNVQGVERTIYPEQIAAIILKDLKDSAELCIQQKVHDNFKLDFKYVQVRAWFWLGFWTYAKEFLSYTSSLFPKDLHWEKKFLFF